MPITTAHVGVRSAGMELRAYEGHCMSRAIRIQARSEIAHRPVSRSRQYGAADLGLADDDTALLPHANGEDPRVVPSIRANA